MGEMSGTRSPTFQPNLFAVSTPTTAPVRSANQAFFCSSGIWNSGYMRSQLSGSTAMFAMKLLGSW